MLLGEDNVAPEHDLLTPGLLSGSSRGSLVSYCQPSAILAGAYIEQHQIHLVASAAIRHE